jgi:hypothetical protein
MQVLVQARYPAKPVLPFVESIENSHPLSMGKWQRRLWQLSIANEIGYLAMRQSNFSQWIVQNLSCVLVVIP